MELVSVPAVADFELSANPDAPQWAGIPPVIAERDRWGNVVPGHRTEIRSRWTAANLCFLFSCPYEELHLRPDPCLGAETNELWEWDVAEVFLGSDFDDIGRYKEFQVSPQGEWVDLDINRHEPVRHDWRWNSGMSAAARIDAEARIWYGEMHIPQASLRPRPPFAGDRFRCNLYRIQGPPERRRFIAWHPTWNPSYHTPEAFGMLILG